MNNVFIHLSKPIELKTSRANSKVNYGLGVIMMYQYRLISCNPCTILVSDADEGSYPYVEQVDIGNFCFSPKFCCEPLSVLKKETIF